MPRLSQKLRQRRAAILVCWPRKTHWAGEEVCEDVSTWYQLQWYKFKVTKVTSTEGVEYTQGGASLLNCVFAEPDRQKPLMRDTFLPQSAPPLCSSSAASFSILALHKQVFCVSFLYVASHWQRERERESMIELNCDGGKTTDISHSAVRSWFRIEACWALGR